MRFLPDLVFQLLARAPIRYDELRLVLDICRDLLLRFLVYLTNACEADAIQPNSPSVILMLLSYFGLTSVISLLVDSGSLGTLILQSI